MIYYTGDIHGNPREIVQFCDRHKLTEQDTLVLLGDVGANYFLNGRDAEMKQLLTQVKPTLLCIHGNHEVRPSTLPSYQTKEWNGGTVWVEETYPRLLFAADGEIFHLEGLCHLVIGGAYSVDKFYRLDRGYGWWPDDQPSQEIKEKVIRTLDACGACLQENQAVIVKGKLSVRDEKAPQLLVDEVHPLGEGGAEAVSTPKSTKGDILYIKLEEEEGPVWDRIRKIFLMFPGTEKVVVYFAGSGRKHREACVLHPALIRELEDLLGEENVVLKHTQPAG